MLPKYIVFACRQQQKEKIRFGAFQKILRFCGTFCQQEFFQTVCGQRHGDAAFHLGQYAADGIIAAGQGGKVLIQSMAVEKIQIACLPVRQTLPQQRETAAKSFAAYDFKVSIANILRKNFVFLP